MRTFEVYTLWGISRVKAERIERHSKNDSPTKILFLVGDEIVAEFYCERVAGWIEKAVNEVDVAQPDVPDTNAGGMISRQVAIDGGSGT